MLRNKLTSIEEETKAAVEIVSEARSVSCDETAEEPQGIEAEPICSLNIVQTATAVENPIAQEKELTASLRRLSFDPMPFVNTEGIVILHTEAEVKSLCRYVMTADTSHISIQSHFQKTEPCLMGLAISWSDDVVAYISLSDDQQRLRYVSELMELTDRKSVE